MFADEVLICAVLYWKDYCSGFRKFYFLFKILGDLTMVGNWAGLIYDGTYNLGLVSSTTGCRVPEVSISDVSVMTRFLEFLISCIRSLLNIVCFVFLLRFYLR